MLSHFLVFPLKTPIQSPPPAFMTHPLTSPSLSCHSPTMGHPAFKGSRTSPLIDVLQTRPSSAMYAPGAIGLPCVLFGW